MGSGRQDVAGVTLALCGDVMLGRGIDQVLPHPGDPTLWEPVVGDAVAYVRLAEGVNGPIPRPVPFPWPWGVALTVMEEAGVAAQVLNLETSITRAGEVDRGKTVHYRMSPDNLPVLTAAQPDVCVLANNHVLDFGRAGLADTLRALQEVGIPTAGAGEDLARATRPTAAPLPGGGRLLVLARAMASSGVPTGWAAGPGRSGVAFAPEPTPEVAHALLTTIHHVRRPGDLVVVSLHWGSNWGHAIPASQVRMAHLLTEGGVDVVYGHSSHHPRAVEVHAGRLILYGCGDLINDYEGIRGHEVHRPDLRLLHLADLDRATGGLRGLRMVPMQARRLRLEHASADDTLWLARTLEQASRRFGTRVHHDDAGVRVPGPAG